MLERGRKRSAGVLLILFLDLCGGFLSVFSCSLSTTLDICVLLCILFPSSFHINHECEWMLNVSKCLNWDSLVVQSLPSNAGAVDLIPGWGAKARYALGPKHKTEAVL